jgi:uncharacterized hydrophobic protein (TIGR00271 family)
MFRWKQVEPFRTEQLQLELFAEASVGKSYLILIVSSCAIATFGLLSNSAAVIIGAMVIAPLMLPIRALAFGALEGNTALFRTGLISVTIGTLLAIMLSCILGWLTGIASFGSEILARTQPTLLDLGIAIAAGGIGGYGKIEPKVSSTIAGTAIAVALMPPICVIGLGLSQGKWALSQGATLLYLTNLLGIALACMLTFVLAGYTPLHQARKALMGAIALTSILLIPLGVSFAELVKNARLETSLRSALLNRTITFQRLELLDLNIDWLNNPPQVRLTVYAKEPVTSKQVELLESFVAKEIGQPFQLIFVVSYVEEIKRDRK